MGEFVLFNVVIFFSYFYRDDFVDCWGGFV